MAFDRSFRQSLASPVIADSEHFWPRFRCSPLRLKTLRPSGREITTSGLPSAVPRHRSCVTVSGASVCTCGHKLSLTATLSLTPTPPAAPTVSPRFRSAVNPMPPLAIPSRRCRSASFLPPIARMPYCQPRSSHPQWKKPPTFQAPGTFPSFIVCDAGTTPLQGREDLSPPADGNARIIDPTRSTEIAVFTNTPYVSRLRPKHRQPRAFLAEAPLLSASAKTAAVFGSIDCSLRLHSASSTPPSLCFGGMALHSVCTRKLSLATTFRLSPTPLLRRGVGPPPFHRQPETSACYSGPSMPCRRSPSFGRREPPIPGSSHP